MSSVKRMAKQDAAVIVGRGPDSAQAALDLARAGAEVTLLTAEDWLLPGDAGLIAMPTLLEAAKHPNINLLTGATVEILKQTRSGLRLSVYQAPRYIDPELCTACGDCVQVCPVLIPGENGGLGHKAIYRGGVPTTYAIDKLGTAPCRNACPIDQRAQGYVALIRQGDYQTAYHTIKRDNPFPSACGRVCNHLCEQSCTRCDVDEPVAVMALKRFVTDWAWEQRQEGELIEARETVDPHPPTDYRVAIVGSGPAGLTAARQLNRLGHEVTVFEALPEPGGMMRVGIPSFRLPRERLAWDVEEVLAEGVELRLNSRVEDVPALFDEGYDAVVIATGLHVSRMLSIPGAACEETDPDEPWLDVMGAVEFLCQVNLGDRPDWRGQKVMVVGGGSTAMDTARVCLRLGAEVTVVYRRSRAEMPAHDFEVSDALDEGVSLHLLTNPSQILRQAGKVSGVECIRMELGEPDASGRRRPIPIEGSEFNLPADRVIMAIGQTSDLSLLPGGAEHDPQTLMTGRPGLFVAGDVAGADGFVVNAIADGLRVARAVDAYLWGEEDVAEPVLQPAVELDETAVSHHLSWVAPQGSARARTRSVSPAQLVGNFQETELGLCEEEAMAEAGRCLSCGLCSECLACVEVCPAHAIDHQRAAHTFDLEAGAVIWAEGTLPLANLPGVYMAGDRFSLASAVEQMIGRLDLVPVVTRQEVAAPSRWLAVSGALAGSGPWFDRRPAVRRQGVFLCRCGGEIEQVVDLASVAARLEGLPGVVWVEQVDFACHPEGSQAIRSAMAAHELDSGVLAACSCCALDQICYSCTTQRTRCKERLGVWSGVEGLPIEFVNLREQCAFVHGDDPKAATLKAGDMVAASVASLAMVDAPGLGPSSRVLSLESRSPITALVNPVRCRGCDDCVVACGLEAMALVKVDGGLKAQVDPATCLGCGICMAACPSGAIVAGDVDYSQAEAMLAAMGGLDDKTVVFCCNWGAYSAVEAAGVGRLSYDPSVRLIRMMCAGQVHSGLILQTFAQGAARVLVLGCAHEEGESLCRYQTGSDQAGRMVEQTQALMGLLGIDRSRLAFRQILTGDGESFVAAVDELVRTGERQRAT